MPCCNRTIARKSSQRTQSTMKHHFLPLLSLRSLRSFAVPLLSLLLSRQAPAATTNVSHPVFHTSLRSASEAAAADQSLVMVIFGADWCGPCKQLKAKTLDSREFMEQ